MQQLTSKIKKILLDDSGIAVAYTIAVFLVFFMMCISVLAMSENIRRKEELQNACDAAAYSGAVVEADILSRVAVLNRALSWTYVMTNRRQMDQTVHNWLVKTVNKYDEVEENTKKNAPLYSSECLCKDDSDGPTKSLLHIDVNGSSCGDAYGDDMIYWMVGVVRAESNVNKYLTTANYYVGKDSLPGYVWLNGRTWEKVETIRNQNAGYVDQTRNIEIGRNNISIIEREIRHLTGNVDTYVQKAVNYTVQSHGFDDTCKFVCLPTNIGGCFERELDENNFLAFNGDDVSTAFSRGGNVWWKLDGSVGSGSANPGIGRHYDDENEKSLKSEFCWVICTHADEPHEACDHHFATGAWEDPICGETTTTIVARPQRLTSNFFGKQGTVVVGAQMSNVNPLSTLFGQSGIYDASVFFGKKLTAVSAARAGIRLRTSGTPGEYSVFYPGDTWTDKGYKNGVWNLCEEDWDAVMLPINRAWCSAKNNGTTFNNNGFTAYSASETDSGSYSSNAILNDVYAALGGTWTATSTLDNMMWH